MARRRMIDPNIWESDNFGALSFGARLLLIGMISNADDHGKGRLHPAHLRSSIFQYDDLSLSDMDSWLSEIKAKIDVDFYFVAGTNYYRFKKWKKWQSVNRPRDSLLPDPPEPLKNQCNPESLNESVNESLNESRPIQVNTIQENTSEVNTRQRAREDSVNVISNEKKGLSSQPDNDAFGFERFAEAYPLKSGMQTAARDIWVREIVPVTKETVDEMIRMIELWKASSAWQERGGKYIPSPEKWLRERRWEGDLPPPDDRPLTDDEWIRGGRASLMGGRT